MWLQYVLALGVAVAFIGCRCRADSIIWCVDLMRVCEQLAADGQCETNPAFMVPRCRRACHACPRFGCYDVNDCRQTVTNDLCRLAPDYMFCHCRQSCGLCLTQLNITCPNSTNDPSPADCSNTADDVTCSTLVQSGACLDSASSTLMNFVEEHCALACGFCTPTTTTNSVSTQGTPSPTAVTTTTDPECQDWDAVADQCARWAADGRCTDLVMATHCARTCNLCQTNEAGTIAQPDSHASTSQRSTYHHGIITTTTLNDVTSPRQSTQAPVNVVSSTSLLTSVSYVSVGRTSQATVKPMSLQTTSSALLSLMISAASQHETASLSRQTTAATDSNVTQPVTASTTDRDPAMTSLTTASHSSLADEIATVRRGEAPAADSSITTDVMSNAPVKVITSTTDVRLTLTNATQDYLSGTSDAYLHRSTVTPPTNITTDHMTVTVTSADDVMSLAAESRDRLMTSSSRDSPAMTSFQSSSDPFVQLVSRLTSIDNDTSSRPHTKPTLPHTTSASKRNTTFRRYLRSVRLSYFNITSSNSSNSSSSSSDSSSGGDEETVGLPLTSPWRDVTHDNATRWSRSPAPSSTTASTQSTVSLYSVTDDATITDGILNSSLQTTASKLLVSSSEHTVKSYQPSTLMPDNSDVTSAESISSPSNSSAGPMTDRVTSGSASSAANLMDTTHSGRSPSSSNNSFIDVSIPHITQLSTDNITSQTLLPSTTSDHSSSLATLNSSTNITNLPVLDDFSLPSTQAGHGVTTASLSDSDRRSHTARVSQLTLNISDNYTTSSITDVTNVTRRHSTVDSETPQTPVSASTSHPHAASSTAATVSSSTRSHPVWSTTRGTDTRTPGRHHRSTTGTRTHGRLRSHAGLVTRQ